MNPAGNVHFFELRPLPLVRNDDMDRMTSVLLAQYETMASFGRRALALPANERRETLTLCVHAWHAAANTMELMESQWKNSRLDVQLHLEDVRSCLRNAWTANTRMWAELPPEMPALAADVVAWLIRPPANTNGTPRRNRRA